MANKGCTFGQITRERVTHVCSKIDKLSEKFDKFDTTQTEMFNHLSEKVYNQLPKWASVTITILVGIICATGGIVMANLLK